MGEMRNSLNVEETLQIKKKAKREAIKWTLVLVFILEFIIFSMTYIDSNDSDTEFIAMMQIPIAVTALVCSYICYISVVQQEEEKLNATLAEGCLSTKSWTEVIPIKANEYKILILHVLPTRANFFAKLRTDSDIIDVYIQFRHEKEHFHLEKIRKKDFLNYYSILEESEKEPEEESND